jgi:hypothetical protein
MGDFHGCESNRPSKSIIEFVEARVFARCGPGSARGAAYPNGHWAF